MEGSDEAAATQRLHLIRPEKLGFFELILFFPLLSKAFRMINGFDKKPERCVRTDTVSSWPNHANVSGREECRVPGYTFTAKHY